ncbi:MAG: InlB B-repeat-containing protein [Bacilli bacterium]|nr:InlB B-repeat-containing protein [Bacilli bacterium]
MSIALLASCGGTPTQHIVTFESNGGTHINTQKVNDKKTAIEPNPAPTKTDYTFGGWFVTPEFTGEAFNFSTPITSDITLFAKWDGGPQPTYTIEFQGENCTSTLTPAAQYHTGDEVNFNINVSDKTKYKLPEKINIAGVSSYDYYNLEGKVSFTIESNNVLVAINAEEIEPSVTHTVTFVLNGATSSPIEPVIVNEGNPFPSDKIPANPTKAGHAFEGWSYNEKTKTIVDLTKAPIINYDLILYAWWSEAQSVDITFDANGGYFDNNPETTSKTVSTAYGQVPVAPTPTNKVAGQTLGFKGWSPTLVAATSETTYTAQWDNTYTITISGENVETTSVTFVHNDFRPILHQVFSVSGYVLNENYIDVNPSNAANVRYASENVLEITPKDNIDNITITLKADEEPEIKYFNVTSSGVNMEYFKDEAMEVPLDLVKVKSGEDFVFYMCATQESNDEGNVPPSLLDIKNDQVTIKKGDGYKIENVEGTLIEKKVTIDKKYITGDISIKGDAVEVDCCQITFPFFVGLKRIEEPFYFDKANPISIKFEATDDYHYTGELLTPDNIVLNLTGEGTDWKYLTDPIFNDLWSFDSSTYTLTINANVVETDVNVIQMAARGAQTKLEEYTWEEIDAVSTYGFAQDVFAIGDTKSIYVNEIIYHLRIIDFEADKDKDGNNLITFEFAETIRDFSTPWNNKDGGRYSRNRNFIKRSNLNDALQKGGEVYRKIPTDLRDVIKVVNKMVEILLKYPFTPGYYDTKLFPLSKQEIEGGYAYYKNGGSRAKGVNYWLRSPNTNTIVASWYVESDGSLDSKHVDNYFFTVAPAFCI